MAHHRGVTVRVILDRAFHGQQVNQGAYRQLTAAAVSVHWASAGQIFHQKTITIDAARALIGTGNLTTLYYGQHPGRLDRGPQPRPGPRITATFVQRQTSRESCGSNGSDVVPGAQQQKVADIDTARTWLGFTSEELTDNKVVDALAAAVRRGVGCRIVPTASAQWAPAFTTVNPPAAPSPTPPPSRTSKGS